MAIQNVVLVGASGTLGPVILQALRDASFRVTVLVRQSSTATFPSDVAVARVGDDYPHAALVAALRGQDAVVSTISYNAIAAQKNLIDAAAEAGVQRFIPSEWGSPAPAGEEDNIPFAGKAAIRAHLATKEPQMTWTGICNNDFFEWGLRVGFYRIDFAQRQAQRLGSGDDLFPLSTWQTVGAATVGVLRHLDETKNRLVYVATAHTSHNALIAAAEKATGATFQVQTLDQDWVAEQEAKIKEGDEYAVWGKLWAVTTSGGLDWRNQLDNTLLGVPEESVESVVERVFKEMSAATVAAGVEFE